MSVPATSSTSPVAVVGAGPIGLAAAAQAVSRGLPTVVLEAGDGVALPQVPRPRVLRMHLERGRGVTGRKAAEGRGDPLVRRGRDEGERVGARDRAIAG